MVGAVIEAGAEVLIELMVMEAGSQFARIVDDLKCKVNESLVGTLTVQYAAF